MHPQLLKFIFFQVEVSHLEEKWCAPHLLSIKLIFLFNLFVLHKLGPYQLEMVLFSYNPDKWPYKCVFLWFFHLSYNWFLGDFPTRPFPTLPGVVFKGQICMSHGILPELRLNLWCLTADVLRQGRRRKTWVFPRMAETSFFYDPVFGWPELSINRDPHWSLGMYLLNQTIWSGATFLPKDAVDVESKYFFGQTAIVKVRFSLFLLSRV